MDLQEAFDSGFAAVKHYVDKMEAGFDARLSALERSVAAIPAPINGRDGRDGAPGLNGRDGKDGINGKDGDDGFGFDDMDLAETDDGFALRFSRGDVVKEFRLPIPVYRGGYGTGHAYKRGDTVTWGGQLFHCNADTTSKPDAGDGTWTLAVRKGRDGKDVSR